MAYEFTENPDGTPLTIENAVGQAIGSASICWEWEDLEKAGTFQSDTASEIMHALVEFIKNYQAPLEFEPYVENC